MRALKCWSVILVFAVCFGSWNFKLIFAEELQTTEMVFIPGGDFLMGSQRGKGRSDEHPRHKVYLDAFHIDQFEVTGRDFEKYLLANPKEHPTITGWWGRQVRPDMENRPVFGLSWNRCKNYCEWLGKRMVTEAEWERAAAGLEGHKFPWGNDLPDLKRANFNRCCFVMKGLALDEVGRHPLGATPNKIYDLAGNIAEWVYDWYDKNYYKYSEYNNPKGPINGVNHVIRGGAWNSLSGYLRSSARYGYNEANDFYGIGCRCAVSDQKSK